MNDNDYNEFFRNKLLKYTSPVPKDMWQRIQQKKDKGRRGFIFIWLAGALVLIFLTVGYVTWYSNKNGGDAKGNKIVRTKDAEATYDSVELSGKRQINEPIKRNMDTTLVAHANNTTATGKKMDVSKKPYANKGLKNKSRAILFLTANNTEKYVSRQKERLTSHVITPGSEDSTYTNVGAPGTPATSLQVIGNISTKNPVGDSGMAALPSVPLAKDTSLKKVKGSRENKLKNEKALRPSQKWFAEVYASPELPFNSITSGDPNLADYIKKNYKMLVSYSAGVLAGKSFDRHFSIKMGFQYSQVNTQFGNGNNMRALNKYKSIDIPFLIGYKFGHTDFATSINAGMIFNVYTWYKGISLDSNGNVANSYRQNTGPSLYIGWNFSKKINSKMQLFGEPYFRYRLSYMTKQQSTFNQKINVAGILFGLKYDF